MGLDHKLTVHCLEKKSVTTSVSNLRFFEDMAIVNGKTEGSKLLAISGKCCLELRAMHKNEISPITEVIELDDNITAISASKSGAHLLVNVSMTKPRIELISFRAGDKWSSSIKKYRGHSQSTYILRAQFGGYQENFVICGSEDNSIYIWQRDSGNLLSTIKGHY
jgi:WD40 repeat protein